MKKISWRKASIVGLTLVAVSAVTAAFAKSDSKPSFLNGSLTFNDANGNAQTDDGRGTCTVSTAAMGQSCDASTGASNTSGAGPITTREGGAQTDQNTTAAQ